MNGSSVYLRCKYDNIIVLILIKKVGIFTFKIEFKITGQLLNTAGIYKPYKKKKWKFTLRHFFDIPHVCMHAYNIFSLSLTHVISLPCKKAYWSGADFLVIYVLTTQSQIVEMAFFWQAVEITYACTLYLPVYNTYTSIKKIRWISSTLRVLW